MHEDTFVTAGIDAHSTALKKLAARCEGLNDHTLARALTWLRLLYDRDGDVRAAEPLLAALVAPPERLAALLGECEDLGDISLPDALPSSDALDSVEAITNSIGREVVRHVRAFLRLRRQGEVEVEKLLRSRRAGEASGE